MVSYAVFLVTLTKLILFGNITAISFCSKLKLKVHLKEVYAWANP